MYRAILLFFASFISAANASELSGVLSENQGSVFGQCTRETPWIHFSYWNPAHDVIEIIEIKLRAFVNAHMKRKEGLFFDDYYRQYVGYVGWSGKRIYVNAVHKSIYVESDEAQRILTKRPLVVCDGFDGSWGAVIDPSDATIIDFDYNNGSKL